MVKVLIVFGSLETGGAQLRTLDVCRRLKELHDIQFDFCDLGLSKATLRSEIEKTFGNVYVLPIRSPRFFIEFTRLIRKEKYDVVQSMPFLLSGFITLLARLQNIPIRIVGLRTPNDHPKWPFSSNFYIWPMRMLISRNATQVLAVSKSTLDEALPAKWQTSVNCTVIYNGVNLPPSNQKPYKNGVRQEFGWQESSRIVINVARLSEEKNQHTILKTARLFKNNHSDVRFLLVGDGIQRQKLEQLIDEYELSDICVLAGLRTDVPRLLEAADVFFFPSLWEGLPGAVLEALAVGLPVVASDIPALQEIRGYFPFQIYLAPPTCEKEYRELISTVLNKPVDSQLVKKHFLETPFNFDYAVNAYAEAYGLTNGSS